MGGGAADSLPYGSGFDDVLPAMDLLKQQGLILGLISNMNMPGDELADSMGLTPYLDTVVDVWRGSARRSRTLRFFREGAATGWGSRRGDAIHVGDQLTSDVEGGGERGHQPPCCWIGDGKPRGVLRGVLE